MTRKVQLTAKQKSRLIVKKALNGVGIFAKVAFKPNEEIYEVIGPFVTCSLEEELEGQVRDNTIRFSKKWYISPEGKAGAVQNHSCNPNAKVIKQKGKLFVKAIAAIHRGDEILIDYSTIVAPDDIWQMKCNCGEKECRKLVGPFHKLPKRIREKYLSLKAVPSYIYKK